MKRTEQENGEDVLEDTMSNRRTLRRAIVGVLKQAASEAPAAGNISGSKRETVANQQNSPTAEQTSESRTAIQYGRAE